MPKSRKALSTHSKAAHSINVPSDHILEPAWAHQLAIAPTTPFEDDHAYLACLDALFGIGQRRVGIQRPLEQGLPPQVFLIQAPGDTGHALTRLEIAWAGLEATLEARLGATRRQGLPLPRTERLAQQLKLNFPQRCMLRYTFALSGHSALGKNHSPNTENMALVHGWPLARLIELVDSENPLIRDGIIQVTLPKNTTDLLGSRIAMSICTSKVLLGLPLSSEEFMGVTGTALESLVPNLHLLPQKTMKPTSSSSSSDRGKEFRSAEAQTPGEGDATPVHQDMLVSCDTSDPWLEPYLQTHPFFAGAKASGTNATHLEEKLLAPYTTDLEFLTDCFERIILIIRGNNLEKREADGHDIPNKEQTLRELRAREYAQAKRIAHRLQLTRQTTWLPRLERLRCSLGLSRFEVDALLLLLGARESNLVQKHLGRTNNFDAGDLLKQLTRTLEERINCQNSFYPKSPLVAEGILHVANGSGLSRHVSEWDVMLDFRMGQYFMGVDHELEALMDGTHLFSPRADLDQVILPDDQKKLILDAVLNYDAYRKSRKELGFDDILPYGCGFAFLFYGPSGTGKTLMANAIAHRLKKKILLVNFPSLGSRGEEVLKFLFREARLQNAIMFFDECESLFESRNHGNSLLGLILTELERHDDLVIMATNRPYDLDEAMYRRITHAIEFHNPDPILRRRIWEKHIPAKVRLAPDVDLKTLAFNYEIAGGFIKNAILNALSQAVARNAGEVVLTQDDLEQGARLQLRGRLRMQDFTNRLVPSVGLREVILRPEIAAGVRDIVDFEKARAVLFGQWGFEERWSSHRGIAALFYGPPGTGKSLAAEAIGFELGRPLRLVNTSEIVSKYVGETSKNLVALFREAKNTNSILLFDEAEGLFGARHTSGTDSVGRENNLSVGVLLREVERFPGLIILTTNFGKELDHAFCRRFKFVVRFERPEQAERERLWKTLLPPGVPLAQDVDLPFLARTFDLSGGGIKNTIFKAAAKAALRENDACCLTMADLSQAAGQELEADPGKSIGFRVSPPVMVRIPKTPNPDGINGTEMNQAGHESPS